MQAEWKREAEAPIKLYVEIQNGKRQFTEEEIRTITRSLLKADKSRRQPLRDPGTLHL
jgi:hypothetical protein